MKPFSGVRSKAFLYRRTSLVLSAVMVGGLIQFTATPPANAQGNTRPDLPNTDRPVAGEDDQRIKPRTLTKGAKTPSKAPAVTWPQAGSAVVDMPDPTSTSAPKAVATKGLPITLASAKRAKDSVRGEVEARVLDRKATERAGVRGVLFSLTPKRDTTKTLKGTARNTAAADGGDRTTVTVDYAAFADAFGGGYASRLQLVELPPCALTTPGKKTCRTGEPVISVNDTGKQELTAKAVRLSAEGPTVLAVVAAAAGEKGDYAATDLAASAEWGTNLNAGDFTWSYAMPVPEVPGGLKPSVGMSYSSGSIDGRTGGTNNQGSWVGDGFDLWPGYIERKYKPCADDGEKNADGNKPGDLCWGYDNAFISFNGKGGELVPAGANSWKLKNDDGTKIDRLKSTSRANGDNDGEYWRVTTPDGTRAYFGYNRLSGWAEGKETTDSTWTTPVFGNNDGEPCHASDFASSWCQQGWRWNLDYVIDAHGNAVTYYYNTEKNSYGRNLKASDDTRYTRGGYLDRIEYGLKWDKAYVDKPQAKVVFSNTERCIPQSGVTCAADTIDANKQYWYDTPWDLNCKAGTDCDKGRLSPSFWTRKRLTEVTTQALKPDGAYGKVDSWKLAHRWGTADVDYQLLLDSVQHTGHTASTPVTLPKTTFAYTQLENRLDETGDGIAPFIKSRLSTVADESGGQIDANYSTPACKEGSPPTPHTNTTRCFPQYIGGDSFSDPELHWFNKYVVTSVTATDRTGGSPDQVTQYAYLDGAAWHFDDTDGLAKEKSKTWSQWRGYGHVRVKTGGQGGSMKSQYDSYFLRGMHGDRKDKTGGTKSVTVALAAGEGAAITDHESAAGSNYKTVTFDAPGGKVLAKSVSRPWHHETAKKVRDWGTVTANFSGTAESRTWTSLDNGAGDKWRISATAATYDTVGGRLTQVDNQGDTSSTSDDQCTRTTYASNISKNILALPSRVETVAKACGTTPDRSKDVTSDVRTAYDGGAYNAAPTKGDATSVATLKSHDGTKATYLETGATFDGYGRVLTSTDLTATVTVDGTAAPVRTARDDGRTTKTSFSPATGLPTQTTSTTPPAKAGDAATAQTTTTTIDPLRSQRLTQTDTNGNVTEFTYDALGRNAKVWLANRRKTQTPSYEFAYRVAEGKPVAVTTKRLNNNGGQISSHLLYDGFLRERQSQTPGPDGGRILTDTFYDERGLATKTFAPYYATGAPSMELFKPVDALAVETQTRTTFDGLGRAVQSQQIAGNGDGGTSLATTKTIYGGDRTTVIPPAGGTATTTLTDARGQTTELRQHHSRNIDAAYDTTTYRHTPHGQLAKVTDPAGNSWSYTYDQLGRQTKSEDPDKGVTTTVYDDRGQVTSTKDARNTSLFNTYDNLGRQLELREGSATGSLRASWAYDTLTGAKGHLAETTRYQAGHAYTTKVTQYDRLYRPIRTAVVIPDSEGALAGTYQTGTSYAPSGLVGGFSYSAAGALPGGSVNYSYEDQTLRPTAVFGQGMTTSVKYSNTGKPLQYELGLTDSGKKTWTTNTYEWGTQRLATSRVDREEQAGVDRHATYKYDEMGNILSISDTSRTGTDNQCFVYDYLRRVTEAWSQPSNACATTPSTSAVGGPAPYWNSYTYDKVGNRLAETRHDPAGDTTKNIQRTYSYPAAGARQPHTLSSVATKNASGISTENYSYDSTGNTTARPGQSLTWDAEGKLSKVTEDGRTTEYVYDAGGSRLIGRTATETTLYLGHTEVTLPKGATTAKATRYIEIGGGHQAIRSDDGTFDFTIADHHGTGQLAINADNLAVQQRRTDLFGSPRGTTPSAWPGTKGFVGGTDDTKATGLTHLGAREYDPALGRFISVDPIMDLADPQQMHGYTYANNNPATFSDPTGLAPEGRCGGIITTCGDAHSKPTVNESWTQTEKGWSYQSWTRDSKGNSWSYSRPAGFGSGYTWEIVQDRPKNWEETANELSSVPIPLVSIPATVISAAYDIKQGEFDAGKVLNCADGVTEAINCAATAAPAVKSLKTGAKTVKGLLGKKGEKGASGCKCFLAGTDVLVSDGATKDIEDIELGDKVLATDPETGEQGPREVTRLIRTEEDKNFNKLFIATESGIEQLTATHEHPFWSPSEKRWVPARELTKGMTLRTDDGDTVIVTGNKPFSKHARTYNLTVDDLHTYYVLAGQTPVLVHNSNCDPRFSVDSKGNATDLANPGGRVGVPKLEGGTLQEVGGRVWGSGDPSHLVGTRAPADLRGLASRGDAEKLQDFYQSAALAGKGGKTAPARVVLTQEIIDAWR
ncbi:polymorphic toxin-type HINT domain-containing protein [Streptomyces pratensis]|uniref:polymorphic toxin-type HINT domain-containing protein n=1 Tax=Streptomyces pratensis TaxID=1169025 RepID=UPI00301858EE